jgi:hypothetical protein
MQAMRRYTARYGKIYAERMLMGELEKLFPSERPLLTTKDRRQYRAWLLALARENGWINQPQE